MEQELENEENSTTERSLKEKISGVGQVIIGEIETIGGVLTGDPITRAEGEFNVEVGSVRDEIEEELADQNDGDAQTPR